MSTSGYFRRSRNGCATCRRTRLKCDEAKPWCRQCTGRGIKCDGYPIKLRWVEDGHKHTLPSKPSSSKTITSPKSSSSHEPSSSTFASPSSSITAIQIHGNHSLPTQQLPPLVRSMHILPDASSWEMYLFDYDLTVISKVAYVDCIAGATFSSDHISTALTMGPNSLLFNCIVAHSAAHLNQAGHVSEQIALSEKHKALRGLRTAISSIRMAGYQHSCVDVAAEEINLSASGMLVGLATTQGSPPEEWLHLVMGSAVLAKECYQKAQGRPPSESLYASVRMLAYFDILSSVPYPRAPALPSHIWYSTTNINLNPDKDQHNLDSPTIQLDPMMGYLTDIFAMVGKCSHLIFRYYSGDINSQEFAAQKTNLSYHLSMWSPPSTLTTDLESVTNPDYDWINSTHAGEAYRYATQIYLHRSYNSPMDSKIARSLFPQLKVAVFAIPLESTFTSMILWPAFVLGCETADLIERERVEKLFQNVLTKQGFGNIRVALDALKRLWGLLDEQENVQFTDGLSPCSNSKEVHRKRQKLSWVMLCWEKQIILNLA